MTFRKIFWLLSALIAVFIALQALGYGVLEIIVSLILINLAVVELSRQQDRHNLESRVKPELMTRVGNVEKLCSNMLSSINALPSAEHFCQIAEQRIAEHGTRLKAEIKDDLDRLAKKAVDIENRIFDLKKSISSGICGIDERLRAMETGKWTVESAEGEETEGEEVELAITTEELPQEQPVLEEVIYGENVME